MPCHCAEERETQVQRPRDCSPRIARRLCGTDSADAGGVGQTVEVPKQFSPPRSLPELADRLKAARLAYKKEKDSHSLGTELLFVIYGNEAPALSSVARRLGISRASLVERLPHLCRVIAARYLRTRKEIKIERLESLNENARRIARNLHRQGLRPTHARIRELLPADSIKDWAALHRAVKRAKRFLGASRH